jgi:hypothetical protein
MLTQLGDPLFNAETKMSVNEVLTDGLTIISLYVRL